MKNTLHLFLTIIFLFSGINSFAETNLVCPTATISYSSSMYCSSNTNSQTVNLTGTDAYTGGTFTSMPVGLNLNSTTGAFIPSSSTPGVYTITYTIAAGSGCPSFETTTTITILAQPNAGTDSTIYVCENDTTPIDLYNVITGEQTGGVWVQTSGSGGTFNAATGTFAITPGTTTTSTFEYILTSSAPCTNDSSVATVIIGSVPTISSIDADQTTICNNQFVTLTSNSNPSATAYNWQINSAVGVQIVDGATSGTSVTGIINLQLSLTNPMMAGTISFDFTPVNGICTGSTTTNAITITVNPIPGTPIGLPTMEICSGEITNFTISPNINIAGTILEWTVTDSQNVSGYTANGFGLSPLNISDVLSNTSNTQGFVKYRVTSKLEDCEGGSTDYIVFVNPQPNTGFNGNTFVSEASTTPIDLFSIITDEESGGTWTRVTGSGGTFDEVAGTFTPSIGSTDSDFTYMIINSSTSCYSNSLATIYIDVVPVGVPSTNNQTITNGGLSNITLSSSNAPNSDFTWTFVANNISGASNGSGTVISQQLSLINPNLDGYVDYTITPINNSASGSSFAARVSIQSVLNSEAFITNVIKLSPNPVTDILNIENEFQINSIKIYNQLGQMIFGKEINNNTTQLDLSVITSGIYNLSIETEKGTVNHKIIKK